MLLLRHLLLALLATVVLGCADSAEHAAVGAKQAAVVYGSDDRLDVFAEPDMAWRKRAEGAVLALIPTRFLNIEGAKVSLGERTLDTRFGLCDGERFASQPAIADCSATLIDEDLVLTAGHCFGSDSAGACQRFFYVFDYRERAEGQLATIEPGAVYGCKRIVARKKTTVVPDNVIDYAVVQLDRPVSSGRASLTLSQRAPLPGENLTVMGFPSGLPLKLDHGATVLSLGDAQTELFSLSSDTFAASSGSGIFDATGLLLGTIVSGGADYRYVEDAGCQITRRVDAGQAQAPFEQALRAEYVIKELCEAGWPNPTLCGRAPRCGDGFCSASERETCAEECGEPSCDAGSCGARHDAGLTTLPEASIERAPDGGKLSTPRETAPSASDGGGCSIDPGTRSTHGALLVWALGLLIIARGRRRLVPRGESPTRCGEDAASRSGAARRRTCRAYSRSGAANRARDRRRRPAHLVELSPRGTSF